jgi:hypothetical protein
MGGNYKHGGKKDPLYQIWKGMKTRCYNSNNQNYARYGARGISVCSIWKTDYKAFSDWAYTNGYVPHMTMIDRINNNGGYSPENCRFVSQKESANNTSKNILLTAFGETKTLALWVDDMRCIVKYATLYYRSMHGWDTERALTTPSNLYHQGQLT